MFEEEEKHMLILFLCICLVAALFGLAFRLTGAVLAAVFWMFIKLPVMLAMWIAGIVCCCTIILIPVGLVLFRTGFAFL